MKIVIPKATKIVGGNTLIKHIIEPPQFTSFSKSEIPILIPRV